MKKKIPKFYFFRIAILSTVLYFLLIAPVNSYLFIRESPTVIENIISVDSLNTVIKNLNKTKERVDFKLGVDFSEKKDSLRGDKPLKEFIISEKERVNFIHKEENHVTVVSIITMLIVFIFHLPFKIYFYRLRQKKPISDKLQSFCRKYLIKSPVYNAYFLLFSFFISHLYLYINLHIADCGGDLHYTMFLKNFILISFFSKIILLLFIYHWTKHRVHFYYLEHVYTKTELKKRIFKSKPGKIRNKLWSINILTAVSPIIVVVFYLILSINQVVNLNIGELNESHLEILLGKYHPFKEIFLAITNGWAHSLGYINLIDTILLLAGISSGIVTVLFYIYLFSVWNNESIVFPVNDILEKMKLTGQGKLGEYSIVRTNDEIGVLSEGYNNMASQIKDYVEEITDMNKNLEKKVEERTAEVMQQKEEIETQRDNLEIANKELEFQKEEIVTQRDEIEAQRDEIEAQRNLAMEQKAFIESQKNEITDSIKYAGNIQQAVLQNEKLFQDIFPKSFIVLKPRDIVSGDFYWFSQKENKTIVCAADCTGHGVPGGFMSMLGMTFLNEIVNERNILKADVIVNNLRKKIIHAMLRSTSSKEQLLQQSIAQMKDGMDLSLIVYDKDLNEIEFTGANNPLYLLRKKGNTAPPDIAKQTISDNQYQLYEFKGDKMPVGAHQKSAIPFSAHRFKVEPGDTLYMFSDGFPDQFGPAGKFKMKRFKQMFLSVVDKETNEQKQFVENTFNSWKQNEDQIDDVLVIGVKIS